MDSELIRDKFIGALLGTAVGDALGMPVEGLSAQEIEQVYGSIKNMGDGWLPKGTYTDDTQLMIGLAESFIECKGFNGNHMSNQFVTNYEAHRGYGPGTVRVFENIKAGQRWNEAAAHLYGGGSYGNGAAMRIAPVGAFYYSDPGMLKKVAEATSRITHTHQLGIEGAVLQAYSVGMALSMDVSSINQFNSIEFINNLFDAVSDDEYQGRLVKTKAFLENELGPPKEDLVSELGVGVQAHKSVPIAIYSFLKNPNSFRDAVCFAVNMGGDTDTIGAMTGALAGALHGVSAIPEEWLNDLENNEKGKDYVWELGEELFKLAYKI